MGRNKKRRTPRAWKKSKPVSEDVSAVPLTSADAFTIMASGEIVPSTSASNELDENASVPTLLDQYLTGEIPFDEMRDAVDDDDLFLRPQSVGEVEITHEADELSDEDEEEEEILSESHDSSSDDEQEILDDGPSTSTGRKSRISPVIISDSARKSILESSTATEKLLNEIKSAYVKKGNARKFKTRKRKPKFDDKKDENESDKNILENDDISREISDEYSSDVNDSSDEDYVPSAKSRPPKKKAARPEVKIPPSTKSKNAQKTPQEPLSVLADDFYNWTTATKNFLNSADGVNDLQNNPIEEATVHTKNQFVSRPSRPRMDFFSSDDEGIELPKRRRRLPIEVQNLLGQANVSFVQGRRDEALKMVEEVVRLHPGHYEAYNMLSSFYADSGDKEKQLQFGLLGAHLESSCSGETWADLAQLALEQNQLKQAIGCFIKAYKAAPTKLDWYNAAIGLLQQLKSTIPENEVGKRRAIDKQIDEAKLAAVRSMLWLSNNVSSEFYFDYVKGIFQEFYDNINVQGAIVCLQCLLERAKLDDEKKGAPPRSADKSHEMDECLNHLMEMAMHIKDFETSLQAVFRYSKLRPFNQDGSVNIGQHKFSQRADHFKKRSAFFSNSAKFIPITHYDVPEAFPVDFMGKAIVCWIRLKRYDCAKSLMDMLESEVQVSSAPDLYWEIAEAFSDTEYYTEAEKILVQLIETSQYQNHVSVWLRYAEVLSDQGKEEVACAAFGKVVQLAPQHVGARLSLAALQQELGQPEAALHTLNLGEGFTLENLNERLLYQRCILLRQHNDWDQFLSTGRYLMAMYFREAYREVRRELLIRTNGWALGTHLRAGILDTVRNTNWERLVKRVPHAQANEISADELWEIFDKMCELLYERRLNMDLLYMCCYATQCTVFARSNKAHIIINMLLFSALSVRHAKIAWTVLRYSAPLRDEARFWNVFGLLFVFSQEIRYHRFTLRATLKLPDSIALAWMSGNNSIITGTYQHALAEYFYILQRRPEDPLLHLLIGICFVHLATRKAVSRRHDLCIQGLVFLSKYEELRGECQEVYFNIGRALQQVGMFYAAMHYYKKALALEPPVLVKKATESDEEEVEEEEEELGKHKGLGRTMFDLRPLAAHNLSLIYQNSNNMYMARELLERYCTVE